MPERFIEIDGSMGEGGGAVLRTALALGAVNRMPVWIHHIRAKRKKPGLQPQHLKGVEALATVTGARVRGMELNSTELFFEPSETRGGKYKFDIGTAGSTTLILQILMPALAFASEPAEVEIRGGTDNPFAPPVDFLKHVTLPIIFKLGYRVEVECLQRGHYPRGGGRIRARTFPVEKLQAIHLTEAGKVLRIAGISHCVKLPPHVGTRQARAAKLTLLKAGYNAKISIETYDPSSDPHLGPGSGITIWAETESGAILGSSSLGKPGKPAERVGREAASSLVAQLKTGFAVDRYLTDQLIPYIALAEGRSEIWSTELTTHTLTNVELVEKILGVKFEIDGKLGEPGRISVEGRGLTRGSNFD